MWRGKGRAALLAAVLIIGMFACGAGYGDVTKGSWYYGDITEMSAAGLLKGYPDGSFRPNGTITAAEFTAIVCRCAGISGGAERGHWAGGYMVSALEKSWYDWDELPPTGEKYDRPISRQLAVKIVMNGLLPDRAGEWELSKSITDFSSLNGRYYNSVLAAYSCGVARGDETGRFRPEEGLSRAEACALINRALKLNGGSPEKEPEQTEEPPAVRGGVSQNGRLKVVGAQLCNEKGEPVILRGMSSHGLQWYGNYASQQAMAATAEHGANVFRLAMYTAEGGYLSDPTGMKDKVTKGVEAAVKSDMYVIIDWHILSDGDPMNHVAEAESFFSEMAERYKDQPAIIYEICNEPNGGVTWQSNIKPYAERIVAAIRAHDKEGIILIGSGTWSQDIHTAAGDPLKGENLMYTCHFYAGTHGSWLRDRIDGVLKAGLPVFVSEWGTSAADGSGGVFERETEEWLAFLNERRISWCNWSLCDKNETSAALTPGASPEGGFDENEISPSGRIVFKHFKD